MRKKFLLSFIFIIILFMPNCFAADTSSIEVNAEACILAEEPSGKIIYEKNSNTKMYPASTTKILTALLTLENCNLTDIVPITKTAKAAVEGDYDTSYLYVGEEYTVEQLLNLLLIPSANVAGNALAEHVSGSIPAFVNLMNTRAKELGCTNTHFTNVYGMHDENHYTTASDLLKITEAAMKYDTFKEIVKKTSYEIPASKIYDKDDRILYSTNDLIKPRSVSYYKYANGIKTGTTTPAKDCLVASATKDNMTFYAVILGASKDSNNVSYRYSDAKTLFDFGFKNYEYKTLASKGETIYTTEIKGATKDTKNLDLTTENNIVAFIDKNEANETFFPNYVLTKTSAPITKGEVVGTISYNINNTEYTANLIAKNDVNKSYMYIIFIGIGILFLAWFIKFLFFPRKRKRGVRNKRNIKRA